jgi:hypothetical protein
MDLVEMHWPEIAIGEPALEHVVQADQQGMRDGHESALGSSSALQTTELCRQVGVFGSTRSPSGLYQGTPQPATTLATRTPLRLVRSLLPGQIPAQDDRCAAVGKRDMSLPISAKTFWALRWAKPGLVIASPSASSKGRLPCSLPELA